MKTSQDPRHAQRKRVVEELFEWHAKQALKLETPNPTRWTSTTKKIVSQIEKVDQILEKYASKWPKEKINNADIAILRLAIFELFIEPKEPNKVIIDEAVELAKEYSGDSGPSFVNGVLGKALEKK